MVLEPPDVIEEADLTDSDREILGALADGRLTKGAIVERTGLHRNTVRNRLDVLVAGDAVDAVHKGTKLYELADDPRDGAGGDDVDLEAARDAFEQLLAARERVDQEAIDEALDELAEALGVERDA